MAGDKKETEDAIVFPAGETMRRPEGLPAENHGTPEYTDWQERAFALAREIEVTREQNMMTLNHMDEEVRRLRARVEELEAELAEKQAAVNWPAAVMAKVRAILSALRTSVASLRARLTGKK